jgi:hypothetical protein
MSRAMPAASRPCSRRRLPREPLVQEVMSQGRASGSRTAGSPGERVAEAARDTTGGGGQGLVDRRCTAA